MRIKKFNESANDNLSIQFAEWAADFLFEPMYHRIGFDTWISRFDGEKKWKYNTNKLISQGIENLQDIDLWTKFCQENTIELTFKDKTSIILDKDFEPINFFKFICQMGLVKYNWTLHGVKQPFYWTNIKKEKGKYSTQELYDMFLQRN